MTTRKLRQTVAFAHCPECDFDGRLNLVDNGIGTYEYWGDKSTHHDYTWECSRCSTQIPTDLITYDELDYYDIWGDDEYEKLTHPNR